MFFTETISTLIDAGLSGETLKTVVAALERDMVRYAQLREHVTPCYANEVSPAALRMRKMREKQRLIASKEASTGNVTVTEQSVTSYNNNSSLEVVEKEDSIVGKRTRLRNSYTPKFLSFWSAFPTDKGMSKLEAFKAFQKLSSDEQDEAIAAIPEFKKWVAKQGDTYRVVHACRYISQRRFEGFVPGDANAVGAVAVAKVAVSEHTAAWACWKVARPTLVARDIILQDGSRGRGWYFPTEYPPNGTAQEAA